MRHSDRIATLRPALVAVLILVFGFLSVSSGERKFGYSSDVSDDSCTSIMVGRLASSDGSVITSHSCDGNYRTWLNVVPHQKHERDSIDEIFWGTLHTESPWDMKGKIRKGEIPQVEETYAYLNTAYPCLNERQLAIGETTISGRPELRNDEGLFLIEELERVALERCRTAREAIRLIGDLVKNYGYGDRGECLTIADPREVWQLEIFGAGPSRRRAVWAAARIPDDHVGVSANLPRISGLDLKDSEHCLASDNVYSLAEEMGWWRKEESFKFWKAYSGRKPFSDREYYILSTLAPSLGLQEDAEELPFSVKPSRLLGVEDLMKYYRETYEGTAFDMTRNLVAPKRRPAMRGRKPPAEETNDELVKSPVASAWMGDDMVSLLNALKPGVVEHRRPIAVADCSYSEIIQCRNWLPDEIGGLAWFSFDNPAQSPRIPIFSGVLSLPGSFEIDSQHRYNPASASWAFRRTNRLAAVKWGATRKSIEDAVAEFQQRALVELPSIEKIALQYYTSENGGQASATRFLTKYTNDFARAAIDKWSELEGEFWTLFARGF